MHFASFLDSREGLEGGTSNSALQQLARRSVSIHAEASNASNQVRIRELDAAERRANDKKDRIAKLEENTRNLILMASSSTDSLRQGEITTTFKSFMNCETAALAHQTLLTQFK